MPGGRPPQDERKRFLEKVRVMPSGCHEWQSTQHRDGYGKFYFRGRQVQAHRAAFILFKGELPKDGWVLHTCDNRKCVNPDHLFLGDAPANIRDMDEKQRRGTRCQLTELDVQRIRLLLDAGVSQQKIADAFGVHQGTISRVKLGKTTLFKH